MSLLRPAAPRHPDPEPLELDDTRVVLVGTVLWAVALVVLVVADLAGVRTPGWWLQMCAGGHRARPARRCASSPAARPRAAAAR